MGQKHFPEKHGWSCLLGAPSSRNHLRPTPRHPGGTAMDPTSAHSLAPMTWPQAWPILPPMPHGQAMSTQGEPPSASVRVIRGHDLGENSLSTGLLNPGRTPVTGKTQGEAVSHGGGAPNFLASGTRLLPPLRSVSFRGILPA